MDNARKIIIVILVFLLIFGLLSCTDAEKPPGGEQTNSSEPGDAEPPDGDENENVNANGNFNVVGHIIYAPDGTPFVPKGTNVNGPRGFFTRDTLQDVEMLCDVWQFNTVRLISTFGMLWQRSANADMEGIVKAFTDRGVVVMIMTCDYGGTYPDDEDHWNDIGNFVQYNFTTYTYKWVELAETFKDNPYVWFNVMTEPAGGDWKGTNEDSCELWYSLSKHLIEAIRATGSENIIVLDEHWWGQGAYDSNNPDGYGSAVLHEGVRLNQEFDNLIYSLHPYGWTEHGYMLSYVKDCHERGLSLVMGEYGAGVGDSRTHRSAQSMFDVAIPYGVGRIHWAWGDDRYHLTATESGGGYEADITDGVNKPTNLTWLGSLIWDDNRGLATSPTPDHEFTAISNGDFKNGLSGWQNTGTPRPLIIDEEGSHNNSACACLVKEGGGYTSTRLNSGLIRFGKEYKFSAWGKSSPGITEDLAAVTLAYRTESGGEETEQVIFFGEAEWTYKEIIFTMPDYVHSARIMVSRPDGTDFFFGDIELAIVINK
jgi:mannan endo-1,4-beta-mannosidase